MRAASGGSSRSYIAFDCKASGQNGFGVGEVMSTLRSMGHKDILMDRLKLPAPVDRGFLRLTVMRVVGGQADAHAVVVIAPIYNTARGHLDERLAVV